jgi:hypothetical protein
MGSGKGVARELTIHDSIEGCFMQPDLSGDTIPASTWSNLLSSFQFIFVSIALDNFLNKLGHVPPTLSIELVLLHEARHNTVQFSV